MLFARSHLATVTGVSTSQRWLFGIVTLIATTWYVVALLDLGWIPHDEGQLGHTAVRILDGELPHRDFVEPYTGGLGYLHAIAFQWFGTGSRALRLTSLPFFAAFVACTYWIANRAAPPWLAAAVTFLCACLTLPVYPASLPSWYNLFAAVCGTAALLHYLDTGRARWACLAGLLAGLSIVIKITGLYFVAAALLFLVYREQQMCRAADAATDETAVRRERSVCFSAIASCFLLAFGGLGVLFLRTENRLMDAVHFGLPFAGLAFLMIRGEWRHGRGPLTTRSLRLAASLTPFLIGVAIPLAWLLAVYWRADALVDLYQGVIVLPGRRLTGAHMALPNPRWLFMAAPWSGLLASGFLRRRATTTPLLVIVVASLLSLFAVSHTDRGHLAIFQGLRNQLPILLAISLVMLAGRFGRDLSSHRRQELFLLTAVAFLVSLVQFPYSGGFYFFYAAPPAVLLALFIVRSQSHSPRVAHVACLVFVVAFLVLRVHTPGAAIAGGQYRPDTPTAQLQTARCGLTVRSDQAHLYHALVTAVQSHSADNAYIFATPDCPEVYFLSGRRNPTRTTYELFDDPRQSTAKLLATLEDHDVRVVVLKQFSEFSTQLDAALVARLKEHFPGRQEFRAAQSDEGFIVLWRS